jgi:serine/threonine protein kinase
VNCPSCNAEVLEIDVKCTSCGGALGATGAHRMIGQVVLSVYELVDVLGQGGMSVVYKARHKMTDQEVALKILPPELAAHSQVKSRFLEEAKALAALDHPNIVHLYNFGQENQSFVLAMQYVQGKTWERLILESKRLDWAGSVKIAVDVLKALEYAHGSGVVHRDMKPSNVLVRAHDHMATVMDFGIAKMTTSTKLTATGQTMGTVRYMSPEQVRGQEVDLRTDIYSLGATLYESLVGDTPFDGSTHFEIMTKHLSEAPKRPSTHGVAMPIAVEDAVMRSLSKRASDRFESARDMRLLLESALREGDVGLSETQRVGGEALSDLRRTPISRAARAATSLADELEPPPPAIVVVPPGRRRTALFVALALLVLVGGGVAAYVTLLNKPHAYESVAKIPGVTLTEGKRFGSLLVETDGTVKPDEVYTAYTTGAKALLDSSPKLATVRNEILDHIVVIPGSYLCDRTLFPGEIPRDCATAKSEVTFGKDNKHLLLVANQAGALPAAMRTGLAQAVCIFENDSACDAAKKFAGPVTPAGN